MKSKLLTTLVALVFCAQTFAQSNYSSPVTHTYKLNHQKCTLKYQTWVSGLEYGDKRKCFFRITNVGNTPIENILITIDPSTSNLNSSVRHINRINPGQQVATWVYGEFEEGQNLPLTLLSFEGEIDNPQNLPMEKIWEEQNDYNREFEKIMFLADKPAPKAEAKTEAKTEAKSGSQSKTVVKRPEPIKLPYSSERDGVINTIRAKLIEYSKPDNPTPKPPTKLPVFGIRG